MVIFVIFLCLDILVGLKRFLLLKNLCILDFDVINILITTVTHGPWFIICVSKYQADMYINNICIRVPTFNGNKFFIEHTKVCSLQY